MERPCSARDSKATVPSDLDTTRPFLPVICGRGGGEGTGCQPLWSPRGWSPWASVSLSPHLGPWGSWVCVAGGCQDPASCQARVPTGPSAGIVTAIFLSFFMATQPPEPR